MHRPARQQSSDELKAEVDLFAQPQCKPLKLSEVGLAVETMEAAFKDDPLTLYTYFGVPDLDRSLFFKQRWHIDLEIHIADAVRRGSAYTVDGGDALVIFSDAPNSVPFWKRNFESAIAGIKQAIGNCLRPLNSKEQKKRSKEFKAKMTDAVTKLKAKYELDEMISLDLLGTTPKKQGLGYASALVHTVVAKGDAESRRVWVGTIRPTTGFYEQFGFMTAVEFEVGADNPTWTRPPVVVCLMVREVNGG